MFKQNICIYIYPGRLYVLFLSTTMVSIGIFTVGYFELDLTSVISTFYIYYCVVSTIEYYCSIICLQVVCFFPRFNIGRGEYEYRVLLLLIVI